ncbi:hypothetical protein J437_LFUL001763, partial [Ladona fulva]
MICYPLVMATPKTPVSILNEYMFRANKIPQYLLIRSEPGPDPVFEYEVTIDRVKVTGSGRNKKDAKHVAARNALAELAKTDDVIRQQLLTNASQTAKGSDPCDNSLIAGSHNTEQVTENAVGALTTLCLQHDLPAPDYKLMEESGPAHCKNFVIHCVISSLQLVGQSGTKKQAKQLSAKRLIERINELIEKPQCGVKEIDFGNIYQRNSVDSEEAKRIYTTIKKKEGGMKCRENMNLVIASCHLNLRGLEGSEATALKNKQMSGNPEDILLRFAKEHKLTFSVEFTKARK